MSEGVAIAGTEDAVADGDGATIEPNVAEAYHPVGIGRGRSGVKDSFDGSDEGFVAERTGAYQGVEGKGSC